MTHIPREALEEVREALKKSTRFIDEAVTCETSEQWLKSQEICDENDKALALCDALLDKDDGSE